MSGQALVTTEETGIEIADRSNHSEFLTFNIAGQLFGIPVLIVQDILLPENIASIPLAPPEVRGSINLRGRIVTVIDVRVRLGLERRAINIAHEEPAAIESSLEDAKSPENIEDGAEEKPETTEVAPKTPPQPKVRNHMMGVTVEHQAELYTLLVDSVGDVISLSKKSYEGNPGTLDPVWREFASGVYRLDSHLMVVLDVERLLDLKSRSLA